MPDPWPKQCPYMDRNERSVIATLVNTNWHLYMLIISGGNYGINGWVCFHHIYRGPFVMGAVCDADGDHIWPAIFAHAQK